MTTAWKDLNTMQRQVMRQVRSQVDRVKSSDAGDDRKLPVLWVLSDLVTLFAQDWNVDVAAMLETADLEPVR